MHALQYSRSPRSLVTRGVSLTFAALAGVGVVYAIKYARSFSHPNIPIVAPATPAATGSEPEATALWQRMTKAQNTVPLQARATVTRWSSSAPSGLQTEVFDVVEDSGGRYRFTYHTPASVQGRVVVSNGKTVYQYEPARGVVLRRPATASGNTALPNEVPVTGSAGRRLRLLPEETAVNGRLTRVLEVRGTSGGLLYERCWVDVQSGRALAVEQYGATGKPTHRVDLSQIRLGVAANTAAFEPNFPAQARIVEMPVPPKTVAVPLKYGLPSQVGQFHVRGPAALSGGIASGHHLLYSDGTRAVSVFVTRAASAARLPNSWPDITLAPGVRGRIRAEKTKRRVAIAWTQGGYRYMAIGRLPIEQMQDVVRGLAQGFHGER